MFMPVDKIKSSEKSIKSKLAPVLADVFGYHALLYSDYAKKLVDDRLLIRHQVIASNELSNLSFVPLSKDSIQSRIHCLYEELPFASDSIDFAFLPEVIQNSDHPHQVLREVERVLIPEGVLVLIINNPIGFTSIKNEFKVLFKNFNNRVLRRFEKESDLLDKNINRQSKTSHLPWLQLGKRRISDWFNLLGIEKTNEIAVFETKPDVKFKESPFLFCTNPMIDLFNKTFADQIIIVGKKKVSTLTPISLSWRKNKQLVRPRIAEPSVQSHAESCITKIVFPNHFS